MPFADAGSPFKVSMVIGTRPEVIKLAPVLAELDGRGEWFSTRVITTGQHREMLEQALRSFGITPDVELECERATADLNAFTEKCLPALERALAADRPDIVIVQGDTTSALLGAIAAHELGIPVAHVEAGLRSGDRMAPYPEEDNRTMIAMLSDLHFAPTTTARENLLREGIPRRAVSITGNTVVDALRAWSTDDEFDSPVLRRLPLGDHRLVLLTAHRRESHEHGILEICHAVRELAESHRDLEVVFPVHMNPRVRDLVHRELGGLPRVHLIEPVSHPDLLRLMRRSWIVLTDSGGMQEEAPSFGKPVLILRDKTERPEVIDAGAGMLVGTNPRRIIDAVGSLMADPELYARMARADNPFGDGYAAARIARRMHSYLQARRAAVTAASRAA
jgi:UDP-N-acetylglucosamine 2-epimerase (non-hydrolysing)